MSIDTSYLLYRMLYNNSYKYISKITLYIYQNQYKKIYIEYRQVLL